MKEINLTPAQPSSEEKKNIAFKKLIDKGKQSGHLSTQDIDTIIVKLPSSRIIKYWWRVCSFTYHSKSSCRFKSLAYSTRVWRYCNDFTNDTGTHSN